ncbi:MAG: thiamine pyrophosphate-dependent enzyme [Cyclobacteriaceae bacterium]
MSEKIAPIDKSTLPDKGEILADYQLAVESREASITGRKEVFMGKAKFGIFGDGKEVAQLAMAKAFRNGDFRSGYYRDQTFMLAIGQLTLEQFFAQLYAHTDVEADPSSAGRLMNAHFGTRSLNQKGEWKTLTDMKNSSSDISPTAGQMPRLVGLAYASKLYKQNKELSGFQDFSIDGNEVAFGTIGNASTSEGHFFEAMNAIGVLQVPVVMSVWDDEYGISVPKEYHTTKGHISKAMAGFQRNEDGNGFEIFEVKGWDYPSLVSTYIQAAKIARKEHVPAFIHVTEVTQPQGHSTSGSHERYKPKDRLDWEKEYDCNLQLRKWIIENGYASEEEVAEIDKTAKNNVKNARSSAWKAYTKSIATDLKEAITLIETAAEESPSSDKLLEIIQTLKSTTNPIKADLFSAARKAAIAMRNESGTYRFDLINWIKGKEEKYYNEYSSHLYSQSRKAAKNIETVAPEYSQDSKSVDGREIMQACFDNILENNPLVFAIGEDVGKIGDVNQGFAGLQEKYGELRVTDTGIREATIIGQGIGAALRGLRPIVEIQYLDYLLYALQTLSDDLATLQYRTKGGQKAPLIIRTRGHRLEGVWHSGSPMGMILGALQGIHVLVPRNMTRAAAFYNTMLASDEPALIIESLNGYRLKEKLPDNVGEMKLALGTPEILAEGSDITLVTYGSTCRIVVEAARQLEQLGISAEVIDVQSLIPFDTSGMIVASLAKTNRIAFIDEDVPGGATAYILQKVLEENGGYRLLDSKPLTISAKKHRPAYGSDGDYFSKPNVEDIIEGVYELIAESDPESFPEIY